MLLGQPSRQPSKLISANVLFRRDFPANHFIPSRALGAGVDGHDLGDTDRQLTTANIQEMLSAGLKSLTYRLRTELANDVWHWNPKGRWSDASNQQGYWISDPEPGQPIQLSYGYKLPHRGNTIDQADNSGYSRLVDGDTETFWKSNPYLDQRYTGEPASKHPQWIVVDLGAIKQINLVRLCWGSPYASKFELQYANFEDISDISLNPPGMWRRFAQGQVVAGKGGDVVLRISSKPVATRFLRILLLQSAHLENLNTTDIRDGLGYSMRELSAGYLDSQGNFQDEIRHAAEHGKQTVVYVSSTDSWHREIDLDEQVEQPGLDRIFQSGLTNGLPLLTPTGLLYDTPDNAVAEVSYLLAKGYHVERLELGEEPDGQYVTPEDYGALYLQFATALHKIDPKLQLGGPSFQEILPDQAERTIKLGNSAWLQRFLRYLKKHQRLQDYSFFSFEWYPFDDVCDPVPPQLTQAAGMMFSALRDMVRRGLPRNIPWIISEYGYSAFASRAEIGLEGALLNADIVGRFLLLGGDQAFLYGYTPGQIARDADCTAGNNMLFLMDQEGRISHRFATYFVTRLLTQEWLQPLEAGHDLYPVVFNLPHKRGKSLLSGYAVRRPDGLWSLLLINKDPAKAYQLRVSFHDRVTGLSRLFSAPIDLYQFSAAQYSLSADANNPYPIRADPPVHSLRQDAAESFELPPYSLSVIRGAVSFTPRR